METYILMAVCLVAWGLTVGAVKLLMPSSENAFVHGLGAEGHPGSGRDFVVLGGAESYALWMTTSPSTVPLSISILK